MCHSQRQQCRIGNGDGDFSRMRSEEDASESDYGTFRSNKAANESNTSSNEDNGNGDRHNIAKDVPKGDVLGLYNGVSIECIGSIILSRYYTKQHSPFSLVYLS